MVIRDARHIARHAGGKLLEDLEDRLGRFPFGEHRVATVVMSDQLEDVEIGKGMARGPADFLDQPDPPLRVDERALLLAPAGRRQQQVGKLCRLGRVVHVLHHQEIEPGEDAAEPVLVNP